MTNICNISVLLRGYNVRYSEYYVPVNESIIQRYWELDSHCYECVCNDRRFDKTIGTVLTMMSSLK